MQRNKATIETPCHDLLDDQENQDGGNVVLHRHYYNQHGRLYQCLSH